ncbi:hypothetical protein F8388_018171 [Cannabis sativa]|uniref:Ycf2 N-terminal domain-containing protein n=1 Tax=Cannabis sativa TaxID=3483 RepID=A0A7J6GB01_CANSA|nr:hypothetical protein F8388_018171 [Cannabis sativa]
MVSNEDHGNKDHQVDIPIEDPVLILDNKRRRIVKEILRECLWAISNESVAGIEISFKEKDTKYLEFLFVYYMDDLIREDHDWELMGELSGWESLHDGRASMTG